MQPDVDGDEWAFCLQKVEGFPNFPITKFTVGGDFIYYATQSRQLLKMRHKAEKAHEIGQFSHAIQPFHSDVLTSIQTCVKR